MPSRSLSDLDSRLFPLAQQHEDLCEASGVRLLIYETYRSPAEQRSYYAQGRLPLDTVNSMRAEVGLPPITAAANMKCVTWNRFSRHNITATDGTPAAQAYDACPLDDKGHMDWDTKGLAWAIVVEAGKRIGLEWGGDFPRFDGPHWQLKVLA